MHFALPDSHVTDIAGDALYAAAVSFGLMLLVPRWHPLVVAGVAAVWCVSVELFQLTGLPERWGAHFTPVMLVLGTVFEPRDIAVYIVTTAFVALVDLAVRRVARAMPARRDHG